MLLNPNTINVLTKTSPDAATSLQSSPLSQFVRLLLLGLLIFLHMYWSSFLLFKGTNGLIETVLLIFGDEITVSFIFKG